MITQRLILRFGQAMAALPVVLLLCFVVVLQTQPLAAGPGSGKQTSDLTPSWVKSKIEEMKARQDVNEVPRAQAITLYESALSSLEAAAAANMSADEFKAAVETPADKEVDADTKKSAQDTVAERARFADELRNIQDASAVQKRLDAAQASEAELKHELSKLETAIKNMESRPAAARAEQAIERRDLDKLNDDTNGAKVGEPVFVAEARRVSKSAQRIARSARINLLEQELISLSVRQSNAAAKREQLSAKLEDAAWRISLIQGRLDELRQGEAIKRQAKADRASSMLAGKYPALDDYAKETDALLKSRTSLARTIETDRSQITQLKARIERIAEDREAAQQIRDIGVVGEEFGTLLRQMRAGLPSSSALQERAAKREQAIVEARLKRLKLDESLRAMRDEKAATNALLSSLTTDPDVEDATKSGLRSQVKTLVTARIEALTANSASYGNRIAQLGEINSLGNELAGAATQLGSLLNDKLLWLPGPAPLGKAWLDDIAASFAWLAIPRHWQELSKAGLERLLEVPLSSVLLIIVVVVVLSVRTRLRRSISEIADQVGRMATDSFVHTPRALLLSAVLALPWPLLMGYAGWVLNSNAARNEFAVSVGYGLMVCAVVIYVMRLCRIMCADNGVFAAHFGWSNLARNALRSGLNILVPTLPVMMLVLSAIEESTSQFFRDGLGRLMFLIGSLVFAAFVFRVFNPKRGVLAERLSRDSWLWYVRGIWHPLLVAAPIAVAALALLGFYDGAYQLQLRMMATAIIGFAALVIHGTATRSLLVARRRLEMQRLAERREKARAAQAAREVAEAAGDANPLAIELEEVDIASVSSQTRTLMRWAVVLGLAGALWFVWDEMLPALGFFEEVQLWTQTVTTDKGTKIVPVFLSNALVALLIAILTLVGARNLPGLLEMTVLQRLHIDQGTRYAVSAVSRYVIIAFGIIIALNHIGADWSQMQWIVAALGVGVGFGLQEIVANFISGLIILFERPVRVGDIVTIGEDSGTVTRIQIRATSITDWDNREILVPNKSLLTEKVTNWTLTESITRLVLKVGIAYGSDTEFATKLILETVKSNSHVLPTPSPSVFFLGFGDSSLDYEVRAFVSSPSQRLTVLHELHVAIERALRESGISIPFPQRDVNLHVEGQFGGEMPAPAAEIAVASKSQKSQRRKG